MTTPYRSAAEVPTEIEIERCAKCGLEIHREPWPSGRMSFAMETMFVLSRKVTHGGEARCPGPPRVELKPWIRALLELIGLA